MYDSFSWVADPGDLIAMKVSVLTLTWLNRRVRAPLLDEKLGFISLSVRSSWKAGGMSSLSSSPSRAGCAGGGIVDS